MFLFLGNINHLDNQLIFLLTKCLLGMMISSTCSLYMYGLIISQCKPAVLSKLPSEKSRIVKFLLMFL